MALNPSAIAMLPFCALGVLVSAGGLDWLDVVAGFTETGLDVKDCTDCTERARLTLTEIVFVDAV